MEAVIMDALLDHVAVGDHVVIPTGINTEIQLIKDTKENLQHLEVTKTDGSAHVIIEGKFNDCKGPVDVKVCKVNNGCLKLSVTFL